MKNVSLKVLIALTGVFSAASALAQSGRVIANVPFAFAVDSKMLPPGHYEIQRVGNQQIAEAIQVRNIDNPQYTAITLEYEGSWETTPSYKAETERMVFDNYDGKYFLHEVRGPLYSWNFEFPVTKAEKTARNVALNATQTTIVAGE